MRYRWCDIPDLFRTPIGRMQFMEGMYQSAWPLLSPLASLYRLTLGRKVRVVAVVGSFGKSTTMRAVATALGVQFHRLSQRNSWSFVTGAVLSIRPYDRHAVIEVGIDGSGQMATYARIIRPNITVVTSIGNEHYRSLGTIEVTRAEKSKMVQILSRSGMAVLNGDDPNVLWMKEQTRARVVTFGVGERNDVRASDITLEWPNGTRFTLHADGQTHNLRIRLIGRHMVYSVLAAVAVSLGEGFTLDRILPALETLVPTPGRMQPVQLANSAFLLRDDFKSPLETINAALEVFSEIPARRRIVVLGAVQETPGSQGPIYRDIGKRIAKIDSRAIFIGTSNNFRLYASGAKRAGLPLAALVNAGRGVLKAVEALQGDLGSGDVVLIKGRFSQRLERVALALAGRTVRCDISFCDAKAIICEHCPMLERGWNGLRVVI